MYIGFLEGGIFIIQEQKGRLFYCRLRGERGRREQMGGYNKSFFLENHFLGGGGQCSKSVLISPLFLGFWTILFTF